MKTTILPALVLTASLTVPTLGAAQANPLARTNGLIEAFKAVKPAPDDGTPLSAADKKANSSAFDRIDAFFDYDTITTAPISAQTSKFSPEQMATFTKDFKELIRLVAYARSGAFLSTAEYQLKMGKTKGRKVDVVMHAVIKKEDFETTVTFHWERQGATFRLIDVSFDGSSLVKDYRNQFSRIITKDGVAGLLAKVQKRLEKERKESVALP